jgi:hypothetical protein
MGVANRAPSKPGLFDAFELGLPAVWASRLPIAGPWPPSSSSSPSSDSERHAHSTRHSFLFRRFEERRLVRTVHEFDALLVLTGSTASAILWPSRFRAADGGSAITVSGHQCRDRPRLNDRLAREPNVRPAQLRPERARRRSRRRRRNRRSRSPPVAAGFPRRRPPGHSEVWPESPPREAQQGRCPGAP